MKTTALIDADIVAYQFASSSQETFKWDEEDTSTHVADFREVTPRVDGWLATIKERLKADELMICLSCPTVEGWRSAIFPPYKQNRTGVVRPTHLQAIKDYLRESFPSYERPTLEADDIMGILSTHKTLVKGRRVIVSIDKDMETIPGWLFNPHKDKKPRRISEDTADYNHLYQTLVGDTVDNYKGCPGIGPVKAANILGHAGPLWGRVVDAFENAGLTREDALLQAQVARIARAEDYDFKRKEIKLWFPRK